MISLLPPNANDTERKLEQALAFDKPLWPLSDALHQLRTKRPDGQAPWLTGEWGIGAFRPHFSTNTDFYRETLAHLQQRGTAAAVRQALSWVGADVKSIDVENFYLHIHLNADFRGNLANFKYAVDYSIPIHLDFYRITSGDDGRHGVYDTRNYDDALYDSDAGVWVDGVLVDYSNTHRDGHDVRVGSIQALAADTLQNTPRRTWGSVQHWGNEAWGTVPSLSITKEII